MTVTLTVIVQHMQSPNYSKRVHTEGFVYRPGMGEGHQVCLELHQQAVFSGEGCGNSLGHTFSISNGLVLGGLLVEGRQA